ncbi:MAG TPA: hypothetical protein VGH74_19140 [Planctomycetaceae bacterium]
MDKTAAELERLISDGDVVGCSNFFKGMAEPERKSFAKTAEAGFKTARKTPFIESPPRTFGMNPALSAGTIAVFSCCSLATLKSLGRWAIPDEQFLLEILLDRRPDCCQELAEFLIDRDLMHWSVVRAMMQAGLCHKPNHDNYIVGMFNHHIGVGDRRRAG